MALGFNFVGLPVRALKVNGLGMPKIYTAKVTISLVAGKKEYEIGKQLVRLDRNPLFGISVNRALIAGQKSDDNDIAAADARFLSTFIELRDGTDIICDGLPLAKIAEANSNGDAYHVNGGVINITESKITVGDSANIAANEVIELIFHYGHFRNRRRA